MLPGGNANRPWCAHVYVGRLEISVVIEHREPLVSAVAHVHVALVIYLNRVDILELSITLAS